MKKLLSVLCVAIITGQTVYAKIWRINNTGIPADFTTAQTAHDNASVANGDTLHFEPSGTAYGSLVLSKRLVIIGNGYHLGTAASNANPDLQANPAPSTLNDLFINSGGSNSVIMGMSMTNAYIGYQSSVNNLLFRRNRLIGSVIFSGGNSSNVQILQSYVEGYVGSAAGSHTNVFIGNSIILQYAIFDSDDNGTFQNNVLHANGGGYNSPFSNFVLRSNICLAGLVTLTNCTVEFNIGSGTQFGTSNGNQSNVNMGSVFLGYPTLGSNSFDGRYQLQNPGPAIAAGYGSVDCGAYGNTTPYIKSGIPDVPSIYKLSVPPVVTNNNLSVIISTRVNN